MPGPLPHGDTFFLSHSTCLRVGLEGHETGTACPPRPHGKQVVTRAVSRVSDYSRPVPVGRWAQGSGPAVPRHFQQPPGWPTRSGYL